jgi:hypothetical protein
MDAQQFALGSHTQARVLRFEEFGSPLYTPNCWDFFTTKSSWTVS